MRQNTNRKQTSQAYYYPNSKKASLIVKLRAFFLAPLCAVVIFCSIFAAPSALVGVIVGLTVSALLFWLSFYLEKQALKEAVARTAKENEQIRIIKQRQGGGRLIRFGDEEPLGRYTVSPESIEFPAVLEVYSSRNDVSAHKVRKKVIVHRSKVMGFNNRELVLLLNAKLEIIKEYQPESF